MDLQELAAWLRLSAARGVGPVAARRLLAAFGNVQSIFEQDAAALQPFLSTNQSRALLASEPEAATLLATTKIWLDASDGDGWLRCIAPIGHPLYPAALLDTEDPPLLLYLMGSQMHLGGARFPVDCDHAIAIVGSRNPTPQGIENARGFAAALQTAGMCIVSGLAAGIDAAAHEGALQSVLKNPQDSSGAGHRPVTLAIVGTGLDRVYPARHRELARQIATHGVIISEYPIGTPPLAANFPRRNRIISGLCRGVLVVEAAPASGSLITARMASEQGREVFAIPGSIHAIQSRGCHALIKQGAKLVETLDDILEELPPVTAHAQDVSAPLEDAGLADDDSALLEALGFDPAGLDALQARTGMTTAQLQVELLELELDGQVARLPGGLFQRVIRA